MLKQRVLTAVALAALFLTLLFFSPWYVFIVFTACIITLCAWEWGNLAGIQSVARVGYVAITVVLGALAAWYLVWTGNLEKIRTALLVGCGWWALALLWVQGYPSSALLWGNRPVRLLMGWLVLLPAWLGLVFLRSEPAGAWLILMVVLIVACADIGAYFFGRSFGRHKLAKAVSPGKTWEGVVGGLATALTVAMLANLLFERSRWGEVAALVISTAFASVLGDLLESMVKRHRGVKDSGQLLPGHGGFLDRVDGLSAAIPVFALTLILTGWRL